MILLLSFIDELLSLLSWLIIIVAIMSWLIAFGVVNVHHQVVRTIWDTLLAITEPLMRPIRRWMPNLGGLDLSPVIVLLIIQFIRSVIIPNIARALN